MDRDICYMNELEKELVVFRELLLSEQKNKSNVQYIFGNNKNSVKDKIIKKIEQEKKLKPKKDKKINKLQKVLNKKIFEEGNKNLALIYKQRGRKYKTKNGYIYITYKKTMLSEHKINWVIHNGVIKEGYIIHHKNKKPHDNDINNLEILPYTAHIKMHKN